MKLGELVDHFRVVYLDDISNQVDGQPDELFGAESIVRLFQAGQDEFAIRTWCLIDDEQGSVCTIDLDNDAANSNADYTGKQYVPYSAKIIRILRARFSDTTTPLAIRGYGYAEPRDGTRFIGEAFFDINQPLSVDPGRPSTIILDADARALKFDRPLDADTAALNLIMRTVRKAITPLSSDDIEASPEIPEDYHLGLCDYAGKELLKGPNIDAAGLRLRSTYAKDWEATVARGRRETRRKTQGPVGFRFGGWAA